MPVIKRAVAKVGELDLFYLDCGSGKTTILCLHGRWGRAETWVDFMETYGERYRILAPDQRGHGLSGAPDSDYSSEELARDAIGLMDGLGIGRAVVFGHSMGGTVAGHLAAAYPERVIAAAILDKSCRGPEKADPAAKGIDPVTARWPLPFASRREAVGFISRWAGTELSREYFLDSLVETVEGYSMLFSPRAMAANIASYRDWSELLPGIGCPVMLARAASHEAVPDADWDYMRSALRRVSAYEMPSPDHNVHLADRPAFYAACDEFLGSLGPGV